MAHDKKESVRERVRRLRARRKKEQSTAAIASALDPGPNWSAYATEEEAIAAYHEDRELLQLAAYETAEAIHKRTGKRRVPLSTGGYAVFLPDDLAGATVKETNSVLAAEGLSIDAGDNTAIPMAPDDLISVDDVINERPEATGGGKRVTPAGAGPDE